MINGGLGEVTRWPSRGSECARKEFLARLPLQTAWWVLGCSVGSVTPSLCTLPGGRALPARGRWTWPGEVLGLAKNTHRPIWTEETCVWAELTHQEGCRALIRDEGKANSYLTCHPNFNEVPVSLLSQLALFPSHSWDLTRSSQLVCITLGCPSSRESPLRWELLGQRIVVWRIW